MNAFRLSGENAAAVAPDISSEVIVRELALQLLQMKTWFGEPTASEKITLLASGDTANTVPKALVNWEALDPLNTIAPFWPKCEDATPR